ncbi:hypothetical protein HY501_03365 [Candidatus Woesearchaeota archaeon]|nr:hypothetical protein [Candidatus Woesearchaeota archaeon]
MLMKAELNSVSIQPSACCVAENGRIKEWYMDPLRKLLEKGVIPVPYGDVVLDKKKGFCVASTEEILDFLAKRLGASRIIMVGKVDGVFGSDGKIIKEINPRNLQAIKSYLRPSDSTDVTGGMVHKVEKMVESTKGGRSAMIINGLRSGRLKSALLGKQTNGTVIVT